MFLIVTGVAQCQHKTDFKITLANVGEHRKTLNIEQGVVFAPEHPISLMEAPITHCEVLAIAVENLYGRRYCDAKKEYVINASLGKHQG